MSQEQFKDFLFKIGNMLDKALDADSTNASKCFQLLYEVQALIEQEKEKL